MFGIAGVLDLGLPATPIEAIYQKVVISVYVHSWPFTFGFGRRPLICALSPSLTLPQEPQSPATPAPAPARAPQPQPSPAETSSAPHRSHAAHDACGRSC